MKEILFSGGVPKEAPTNAEEIIGLGIAGMAISEIVLLVQQPIFLARNSPQTRAAPLLVKVVCKIMLIAKMECGSCLGSRAYTRIQFSRTKTPSCIKPVREEVIQQ